MVTFNGAGIGAIAGANDLSSLSTQLTEMIAHFRSLRQQAASANGLIDAFHSEVDARPARRCAPRWPARATAYPLLA
ncbi:MAG: hypothetical protein IPG34_12740 [Rhodocyclaceae bacterium]|nr:hypothetical protein [Rhodocyclaceae bacterium]